MIMREQQTNHGTMRVRLGHSHHPSTEDAANELANQLNQSDIGLIILFAANTYDLDDLMAILTKRFHSPISMIGCTTAGEIGPDGYSEGGISGVSIHRDDLIFEVGLLESLSSFNLHNTQRFAHKLKEQLRERVPSASQGNTFAFMLIDGLSIREESVTRAFYDGLGGLPLVGGSAGDNLDFRATRLIYNGRIVSNAALLLVGTGPFSFEVFKTQHFFGSNERLVVTGAIPSERIVTEINGCPAAEEYARAVGMSIESIEAMVFAAHPVVVQFGNTDFVRSIQKVNPDGSLTFFCAIDEGIVLRVAKGLNMVENLSTTLETIHHHIGPLSLVLSCDCILRRIEMTKKGVRDQIGKLLNDVNGVGFSTYGEQYCGMHVNQTLTGIAFGRRKPI